jgi:hypothetical protein
MWAIRCVPGATLLSLAVSVSTSADQENVQSPPVIGQRHELFLDDVMIAEAHKVHRTLHQPERHKDNPIFPAKYPEYMVIIAGSVIRDPATGKFSMWYWAGTDVFGGTAAGLLGIGPGQPELDT